VLVSAVGDHTLHAALLMHTVKACMCHTQTDRSAHQCYALPRQVAMHAALLMHTVRACYTQDTCKLTKERNFVVPFPRQVAIFKGPGESKPPVPSSHEAAQFDCIHLLRVMVKLLPTWLPDALFEVLQARWNSRQRLTRCRVNITPGFAALNLSS